MRMRLKNLLVNLIRNQADAPNQLINTVCQQGQPDNSPLQLEYETLMESISLSMRGLVDLSETSWSGIVFKVNKPGSNKSLLWGASLLFVLCLVAVFGGSNGDLQPLLQLSVAAEKAVHSHEPYEGYDSGLAKFKISIDRSCI